MPVGIAGQGGSGRRLEMHETGWGQCRLELQVGAATVDFYWQSRKGKDASRMAQIAPAATAASCGRAFSYKTTPSLKNIIFWHILKVKL